MGLPGALASEHVSHGGEQTASPIQPQFAFPLHAPGTSTRRRVLGGPLLPYNV
jgi:hypothetical protein